MPGSLCVLARRSFRIGGRIAAEQHLHAALCLNARQDFCKFQGHAPVPPVDGIFVFQPDHHRLRGSDSLWLSSCGLYSSLSALPPVLLFFTSSLLLLLLTLDDSLPLGKRRNSGLFLAPFSHVLLLASHHPPRGSASLGVSAGCCCRGTEQEQLA